MLYQNWNDDPAAGVAVKVTCVPRGKLEEHVEPQWIPVGLELTVPDPVPFFVTVSVTSVVVARGADFASAFADIKATARAASRSTSLAERRDKADSMLRKTPHLQAGFGSDRLERELAEVGEAGDAYAHEP
jgi:hypothetical protein